MSRVRAFFLEEASECLGAARREMQCERPERAAVYRAVRRLRGNAQLARLDAVAAPAARLEARVRPREDDRGWPAQLAEEAESALGRLEATIEAVRAGVITGDTEAGQTMDGEARVEGELGMEELEYRGRAALERALELRRDIEDAIVSETPVGPILEELFDLVRLGMA